MTPADVQVIDGLLEADPVRRRSGFDRLKTVAAAASVQRFKDHLKHLAWLDSLGAADNWLAGVPPAKVAHFAGEARVTDAADLRRYAPEKKRALVAALIHTARVRARDEIATMFCKRMRPSISGPGSGWSSCARRRGPSPSGCWMPSARCWPGCGRPWGSRPASRIAG